MEISIIVPVYNVEKYLDSCLNSILGQSYGEFELILVNDGSTDKSGDICDYYAGRDSRIRVFHQKNKGVSEARDKGVSEATGTFIAFIDADDYIEQEYLKILHDDISRYNADIACCDYNEVVEGVCLNRFHAVNKSRIITSIDEYVKDYLEKEEFYGYTVWGKLIRKELMGNQTFRKIQYGEDCIYMSEMFEKEPTSILNTYAGYNYVRHKESATRGGKADIITLQHIFCDEALVKLAQLCSEESVRAKAARRYAHTIYESLSVQVKLGNEEFNQDSYREFCMHITKALDMAGIGLKLRIMLHFYKAFPLLYRKVIKVILICLGKYRSEIELG